MRTLREWFFPTCAVGTLRRRGQTLAMLGLQRDARSIATYVCSLRKTMQAAQDVPPHGPGPGLKG